LNKNNCEKCHWSVKKAIVMRIRVEVTIVYFKNVQPSIIIVMRHRISPRRMTKSCLEYLAMMKLSSFDVSWKMKRRIGEFFKFLYGKEKEEKSQLYFIHKKR
jgi:hypothetical protein